MLTTQQAADRLHVSRPYIAQLVDHGKFEGVERTQSGHRRIPAAQVGRVHEEMRRTKSLPG
jgi:excisionase family DNA binding protein